MSDTRERRPVPGDNMDHVRRNEYTPSCGTEEFIVPLLAGCLETQISVAIQRGGNALDVGCGEQPFRRRIVAGGMAYHSVDIVQNRAGTVDYIASLSSPFPTEIMKPEFELILCTEVLEHVAEWHQAFANLAGALAKGGRLIVTCPHVYPLHEEPHDYWRPTPYALRYFASRAGLVEVSSERAGNGWDVLGTVLADTHAQPASRRMINKVLARIVNIALAAARRATVSARLKERVGLSSYIYLSNVHVYTK